MDIVKITPKVMEYDWGNINFIPALLGTSADGKPKAEVWFGTHPAAESTVQGHGDMPLGAFLKEHAPAYFGPGHVEIFGETLPLLLKVLAIDKPLSIQCHPSTSQAQAGFLKERALHESAPRDAWNYKDANRKAEVLCALTPVTAMCAFRPLQQIDQNLRLLIPTSYAAYFPTECADAPAAIASGDTQQCSDIIASLFETLYTLDQDSLDACIKEYIDSLKAHEELPLATADGKFLEPKGIVLSCSAEYPSDPGLFCPFLLNVLHLEVGEALFLKPQTLHAYVYGDGIELMSASDNVLRGGLTHKKVDVPELMSVMEVAEAQPQCTPVTVGSNGLKYFLTPTEEFVLAQAGSGTYDINGRTSISLMLCVEGKATISHGKEEVVVKKGECCVIGASVSQFTLDVNGSVFFASVPD